MPAAPPALTPGAEMPTVVTEPFTRTDFVRYAGAGGDFHPIHHDEEYATAAGMPSVFGMGMLHAGMLGVELARWVGPDNIRAFKVRFTGQVWPGDVLTFTGRVVSLVDDRAEIELEATSQGGDSILRASATVLVATALTR
ncbi:MAG: MaoC family dehydratase N-terminal domain-containing protein [Thermoleophilia bacterium]|nr:MaoC family dehydratase N-terminal domain-containing protein [Thermoleophilia bacterium]